MCVWEAFFNSLTLCRFLIIMLMMMVAVVRYTANAPRKSRFIAFHLFPLLGTVFGNPFISVALYVCVFFWKTNTVEHRDSACVYVCGLR